MSIGFAVLGAGRIGKVHARALAADPDATLVAVADAVPQAAAELAAEFNADTRDIDSIATSDDVDAVLICTPTDMHADLIEQFSKAGKAIFCEKPIDLDIARVRECLATVAAHNATLMVAFQRRFDPDFIAVKERIVAGDIGDVEMVVLTSRDPEPPPIEYIKRCGGIFRDMTIHDFDVARWLLDEPVATVQATATVFGDKAIAEAGDFDTANVLMTTASGRQATINNSRRAAYGYDQRVEVFGSKGMIKVLNRHTSNTLMVNDKGFTQPPLQHFFMTRYEEAYGNEIAAFIQCLRTNTAPKPTGEDGLQALILADAATRSAAEQCVVHVDCT